MINLQKTYKYLLDEMESINFTYVSVGYDKAGWDLVAQNYPKAPTDEVNAVIAKFLKVFNAESNWYKSSYAHYDAGQLLADFIYAFHTEAIQDKQLNKAQAKASLKEFCKILFKQPELATIVKNELNIGENKKSHFKEGFYLRMNLQLKVEDIFSIQMPVKDKDGNNIKDETQPIQNILLRTPEGIPEGEVATLGRYNRYMPVLSFLLDPTSNDNSLADHIAFLIKNGHYVLFMILQLVLTNTSNMLASPKIKSRLYTALHIEMRHQREAAAMFLEYCQRNDRAGILNTLSLIQKTKPIFGQNYYYQLNPNHKPPKKALGTLSQVTVKVMAYGIHKVRSAVTSHKFTPEHQNYLWKNIKEEAHHYWKSNFTYAGIRAQGPALFWGLGATITVGIIFGGLATFGILPLTMGLFTLGFMGLGFLGPMTIGNFLIPAVATVAGFITDKVAEYIYGDSISKSLPEEIEQDEVNDLIKAERKDLVLRNDEPIIESKQKEDEEESLEQELDEAYSSNTKTTLAA